MGKYLFRRLLQLLPTLFLITLGSFLLIQSAPGGPMGLYTQNPEITAEDLERLERTFGLDQPLLVQYGTWLGQLLRGNWGHSLIERRPVFDIVVSRIGNTFTLIAPALLLSLLISTIVGTISAHRQYSLMDHVTTFLALVGYSIPIFWSGLVAIVIFTVWLRWFPAGGMYTLGTEPSLVNRLHHAVLPVSVLALYFTGYYTRYIRSSMLDVKSQDFIRAARAKGLTEWQVFRRHAAKNAAIPVVTIIALDLPALFAGALFTETIFTWPGMGRLFWEVALRRDYPVLMALVTITAVLVILCNLLADVLYAVLNPRIRDEMSGQ
jgi:peptide/nickel transport system permease protein